MPPPETPFNFGDNPENVAQERTQVPFPLDLESEASMTRSLPKVLREAGDLEIGGSLTLKPLSVTPGNTSTNFPTANAEPASPFDGRLWTNPANAEANDGVYAVDTQNGGQRWQIWNGFGLSIPAGATITGIVVDIEAKVNSGTAKIIAQLTKDGSVVIGINKLTADFTTSDSVKTVGDSADLWGTTWISGDFGTNFGLMLTGNTSPKTYSVDFINITVHFTTTGEHEFKGNVIPDVDDTYALGSSPKRFKSIHVREANIDSLIAPLTKIKIATTDVDLADTDSIISIASAVIPANTLGTDKGIYIRANFDTFDNGAGGAISFSLKYGSTTLTISGITPDGTVILEGWIEGYILADGATNAQELWLQYYASENKTSGPGTAIQILSANKTSDATEDSTTALTALLSANWVSKNPANTMQVRNSIIQVIK